MFDFAPKRIFDILVVGGILFLTLNNEKTGWNLILLGVLGFFAYVIIRQKR